MKTLAVLIVASLLGWLALTGPDRGRHVRELNEALRADRIGRIDEARRAAVELELGEMLKANGIFTGVAVNKPYEPGRLNVYVTSPAAARVTRCGAGNALYDASLDAIFIDESFFSLDGYRSIFDASGYSAVMGFRDDVEFPRIYARFVLLHELGHRQLHRSPSLTARLRDALFGRRAGEVEREADRFSLDAMAKFYAFDRTGLRLVGQPQLALIGGSAFFGPDVPPAMQVHVDLAGTLFVMATFKLHLGTPYSPFHQDRLHPTFLDRARGAIDALLETSGLDPRLKGNLTSLRASLARQAAVGRLPITEVLSAGPIADVAFDRDGLTIVGGQGKGLFGASRVDLRRDWASASRRVMEAIAADAGASGLEGRRSRGFWLRPDGSGILVDEEGEVRRLQGGAQFPHTLPLPEPFRPNTCFRMLLPPQPSRLSAASACDRGGAGWLFGFRGDELTGQRSFADVMSEPALRRAGAKAVEVVAVDPGSLHLAAVAEDDRLVARVTLALDTLATQQIRDLAGPHELTARRNGSDRHRSLLVLGGDAERDDILLAQAPGRDPVVAAWRLADAAAPRVVARHAHFVNEIGADATPDLIAEFDPFLVGAWWLSPTHGLVYYANDSIYRFDSGRQVLEPVFHPTFEGLEVRIGVAGRFALFMRGGARVFVFER